MTYTEIQERLDIEDRDLEELKEPGEDSTES